MERDRSSPVFLFFRVLSICATFCRLITHTAARLARLLAAAQQSVLSRRRRKAKSPTESAASSISLTRRRRAGARFERSSVRERARRVKGARRDARHGASQQPFVREEDQGWPRDEGCSRALPSRRHLRRQRARGAGVPRPRPPRAGNSRRTPRRTSWWTPTWRCTRWTCWRTRA